MLRSLYSGVSGMKGFQTKMDVLANNIANVNTTSFKSSRVRFQDMLSQTVANAQGPSTGATGGINARQVGLGVKVGSIDAMMENGNLQATNRELDFAIEGNGFFTVGTRFTEDDPAIAEDFLYTRDGGFFRDSLGTLVNANGDKVVGYLNDDETAEDTIYSENLTALVIRNNEIAGDDTSANLQSYSIDGTGTITAIYSGDPIILGRIVITTFTNPEGLEKKGNNNYARTNNSGDPKLGAAGDPGFGIVRQGFLEMSNVDLANEFTEMVIASRAYSANSRSITTSDEMLQELINLKR